MEYSHLIILIPGYGLEDLPSSMAETEAASLLNAFAVAWHPMLLAQCESLPQWHRADGPPDPDPGSLVFVPIGCSDRLPDGWADQTRDSGSVIIDGLETRDDLLAAVLEASPELRETASRLDQDLVADFYALATGYVMMELLTRRMYYYNDLDEVYLQREAVAAAEAALALDTPTVQEHLRNCFESFTESRERFHPVESFLVDLCHVTAETNFDPLCERIQKDGPFNVLMTARDLERLAKEQPQTLRALRQACEQEKVQFCGGEHEEIVPSLVPLESALWQFTEGRRIFESLLGCRPTVWGRKRFGLSPCLPQILKRFGYRGALHFLLDDGTCPEGDQSKIRWQGCDGSVIEAVGRLPLSAENATSYLELPVSLAESMEQDQAGAGAVLVHRPETHPVWLDDLHRMGRYSSALGIFVTLDAFFEKTDTPGRLSAFEARQYLSPELQHAVARRERNPISRYADHARHRQHFACAHWCHAVACLLKSKDVDTASDSDVERLIEVAGFDLSPENCGRAETALADHVTKSAGKLADVVLHGAQDESGYLVVNPLTFSRTLAIDLPDGAEPPPVAGPVLGVQFDDEHRTATVKLPGSGFAWIPAKTTDETAKSQREASQLPLAEDNRLRNKFFEAHINPENGGLQSINTYRRDSNRLSQQLAFRFPRLREVPSSRNAGGTIETFYSEMRCRSWQVTCNGPELGEITTNGELIDQQSGDCLAEFRQVYRVWRRRPVLEIDIELDIRREPENAAWASYYACRFAWNDSTAALTRSQLDTAHGAGSERIESLHYLEIASDDERTTLFSSALPFHRKTGPRMVDTLLVTAGEKRRSFRFWVAIDQDYPLETAWDLLTPAPVIPVEKGPPRGSPTGWFFHVDSRNVQITRIMNTMPEPASEEQASENGTQTDSSTESEGSAAGKGFALRLVETEGRERTVSLRCFRTPTHARERDVDGRTVQELTISGDRVVIEMGAYAIADVEIMYGKQK